MGQKHVMLGKPQKKSIFNGRAIKMEKGGKGPAMKEKYNFLKKVPTAIKSGEGG